MMAGVVSSPASSRPLSSARLVLLLLLVPGSLRRMFLMLAPDLRKLFLQQ